jgi:hypothetical protein
VGFDLTGIGSVADFASTLINKFLPDKDAAAKAQAALDQMKETGELAQLAQESNLLHDQSVTNQEEAQSKSVFVSGWRPAVGWCCALGLFYSFLFQPLLSWGSLIFKSPVPPALDMSVLFQLLIGMLGLGGMRSWEKWKGVASK